MIGWDLNKTVPWYIMAQYAILVDNSPVLSDSMLANLRRRLLKHWDEIEHELKEYLTYEDVDNNTFSGEFPKSVRLATDQMRRGWIDREKSV